MLGAFFTATSMIGFIAGAGIIVRNSIILVDFIELRRRQGMPLAEAVIDAGAMRFRPMLLTAAAVVVGASVILTDPIFQGLAVSLIAGAVASTFLSWPTIPILYYMVHSRRRIRNAPVNPNARSRRIPMTVERGVRLMAGVMVLLSLALAHYRLALLAVADGIRRAEPVAVGLHQLVPGHEHPARHGPERCLLRHGKIRKCIRRLYWSYW